MDPQVRQRGLALAPLCGMALEPVAGTRAAPDDGELRDMVRRLWVCSALTTPLLALGMFASHPSALLELMLATPVVTWGAAPFFQRAFASALNRRLNMFTLLALGVGAAYGFSLCGLVVPGLQIGFYFEPAAVITTLALLGQALELEALGPAGEALRSAPLQARPRHRHADSAPRAMVGQPSQDSR